MNELLGHLEAAGWVERRRGEDARVLRTSLTPAGREVLGAAHQAVEAIEERLVSRLNEQERRQLLDRLRRCIDALQSLPLPAVQP